MNKFYHSIRWLTLSLLLALVLVACGSNAPEPAAAPTSSGQSSLPSGGSGETASLPVATATAETAVVPASGAATDIESMSRAVIQIEAQGSFVHPEYGLQLNTAGRGTGFIIDPSGIAVTNNHVVTGAALIKVYIPGESGPRNARILGVSECSDLAVIDIEGEDFPYLEWYSGSVNVGLDIFVGGYPLGDPEYTLTRGIVSKARAEGRSPWSSVESVIEYDATTNPGNSGGPVVDNNGRVVAVHYAGDSSARQAFGIGSQLASVVVEQLRQGRDVDSIGINGEAVMSEDGSLTGIWVSSVKSGSPADTAGIKGGDILTRLEGLVLATDGSMADYCDILRSHNPDATLSIEVLRFDTQEVLEGQLNGRVLAPAFSFANQLGDEVVNQPPPSGGDAPPTGSGSAYNYTAVQDESGLLNVDIPQEWSDVDGGPWILDGENIGVSLLAAPNLDDFFGSWGTPGVSFRASGEIGTDEGEVLDFFNLSNDCAYSGRESYSDALYSGYYDVWTNCGGQGTLYIVLAATPQARDFIVVVQVQAVSDADLEALDRILESFIVLVD